MAAATPLNGPRRAGAETAGTADSRERHSGLRVANPVAKPRPHVQALIPSFRPPQELVRSSAPVSFLTHPFTGQERPPHATPRTPRGHGTWSPCTPTPTLRVCPVSHCDRGRRMAPSRVPNAVGAPLLVRETADRQTDSVHAETSPWEMKYKDDAAMSSEHRTEWPVCEDTCLLRRCAGYDSGSSPVQCAHLGSFLGQ